MAAGSVFLLMLLGMLFNILKRRRISSLFYASAIAAGALVGDGRLASWLLDDLQPAHGSDAAFGSVNAIVLLDPGPGLPASGMRAESDIFISESVIAAAQLYRHCMEQSAACRIFVAGTTSRYIKTPDFEAYRKRLSALGVDDGDMIPDTDLFSAEAEIDDGAHLAINDWQADKVYLVSPAVFSRRAMMRFSRLGIRATPVSTDYLSAASSPYHVAWNFLLTDIAIKERLALVRQNMPLAAPPVFRASPPRPGRPVNLDMDSRDPAYAGPNAARLGDGAFSARPFELPPY